MTATSSSHVGAAGEYGVVTQPNTIRFERLLPGPIERVWSYLTEPDKLAKWLAAGSTEPRVGASSSSHGSMTSSHRTSSRRRSATSNTRGPTHLAILSDNLEGRTPRPFWSTHAALQGDYEQRTMKK